MNEFNVLLAAATNGTPSGSLFDALFARYISPQESWRELESSLPITILAAGEDLIDYRIFGNTENGESVGERTVNLWDGRANVTEKTYEIEPNMPYVAGKYPPLGDHRGEITLTIYDSNMNQLWSDYALVWESITSPSNLSDAKYAKVEVFTPPFTSYFFGKTGYDYDNYIPYGYKLPMVVTNGTTTTTTPIYIGSNPLAEDEYVDFGEQKVYRRTENLWNPNTAEKKRITFNGTITNGNSYALNTIPVEPGLNYVFYSAEVLSNVETFYQFRDDNDEIVGSARNARGLQRALFTAPENATKVLICFSLAWEDGIIRDFGVYQMDTLPSEYIPYIAPTDPPVPIPALPTIQGETIIDYNPSTTPAVEPEKMYIKYKPQ